MVAESWIVERIDAAIARQWHSKHISVATDTDTTIEDTVFSMRSMPRLYNEDELGKPVSRISEMAVSRQSWVALLAAVT
jgi:hypothetical protein